MRRWLGASAVAAAAVLSSATWGTATTTVPLVVHKPAHHLVPPGRGVAYTTNWSGYAAKNATFTDAKGSWVQPAVSCSSNRRQYSSFWVGIDGDTSNTVEQIGTDSDCVALSQATYPVSPGDELSADVAYTGSGSFTLTLNDATQRWSYATTQSSTTATRTSAEWVAEAPSSCFRTCSVLPLANFGTASFLGSSATATGASGSISSFTNDRIVMETNGGTVKANPSSLSPDGSAFSDTWYHS